MVEWSIEIFGLMRYHSDMARKWTEQEELNKRKELFRLYVKDNKTIGELAKILGIGESTVYDRLIRLKIPTLRSQKPRYNNVRSDIRIPLEYSAELAEFVGLLLGDGHLTPTQVTVSLGKKDEYVPFVIELTKTLFKINPKCIVSPRGDSVVYFGSTKAVRWLISMGLAFNKTKAQVDLPDWIFLRKAFMRGALRGLFDTDGSVYKLKFGTQISFTNKSVPLLYSVRRALLKLGFCPSKVTANKVYLTRRGDLVRFFREIGFKNKKHQKRFLHFISNGCVA